MRVRDGSESNGPTSPIPPAEATVGERGESGDRKRDRFDVPDYITSDLNDMLINRHDCLLACHAAAESDGFWAPYSGSEIPEPYPILPDYVILDISIPTKIPFVGTNVQPFIVDKYGNYYVAGGAGAGTSPIPGLKANISISAGYLLNENTTEGEVQSFLKEGSASLCAGFIGGSCGTWGDPSLSRRPELKDFALQFGLFSPQVGVSGTFGIHVKPRK